MLPNTTRPAASGVLVGNVVIVVSGDIIPGQAMGALLMGQGVMHLDWGSRWGLEESGS